MEISELSKLNLTTNQTEYMTTWENKIAENNARCEKIRGLKRGSIRYHLNDDPRASISRQMFVRGLVTIDDEGHRHFKEDGLTRWVYRRTFKTGVKTEQKSDQLRIKASQSAKILKETEGGKVAIVHGGRDCDGVEDHGLVEILPATLVNVDRFLNQIHEWAEGPVWAEIMSPSRAAKIERSRRDLVTEAHEDGHPWVLYS